MDKTSLLEFMGEHTLAVLSSVNSQGKPEAAVIEFAQNEKGEIIFDTFTHFRKYQNLSKHPYAAIVIGWDDGKTVQLEGQVNQLTGTELKKAKEHYFAKNPSAKKFESKPNIVYFKLTPNWARYTDVNQDPWVVSEITFH